MDNLIGDAQRASRAGATGCLSRTKVYSAVCMAVLVGTGSLVFAYTVALRSPYYGTLTPGHHQWVTASTLIYARNWYRDGALNMMFGMTKNPRSIEFPTLASRQIYASYPPGLLVPVYLISLIEGREPDPSMVMSYNRANHFLISLVLAFTVFLFLRYQGVDRFSSTALGALAIFFELLAPSTLYFHQNVFGPDQAILLPFALFVFLEVLRETVHSARGRRCIGAIQGILLFYGGLTDWLFALVALVVYVKRILTEGMGKGYKEFSKNTLRYWWPYALALVLFAVQLVLLDAFGVLFGRFLKRTGMGEAVLSEDVASFSQRFWDSAMSLGFGRAAPALLWGSLAALLLTCVYLVLRKRLALPQPSQGIVRTASLMAMFLVPCFLHVYILREHSSVHDFSAQKFSLPLSTVPFALIPVLVLQFFGVQFESAQDAEKISCARGKRDVRMSLAALCLSVTGGIYIYQVLPTYVLLFPKTDKKAEMVGQFIARNTGYADVVFSPNLEIPKIPPEPLSYSMKRVYRMTGLQDIYDKVRDIQGEYVVNVLLILPVNVAPPQQSSGLLGIAEDIRQSEPFLVNAPSAAVQPVPSRLLLYKISKTRFLGACNPVR